MSKITKLAASFLAVLLLFAQVVTVHAASATEPTVNPKLYGLFDEDGQGNQRLMSLSSHNKQPLEYRGNSDLKLKSVICQLNAQGNVETYYVDRNDYIYVEDAQDHHLLNRLACPFHFHKDYAAGPVDYQSKNGYVVGAYDRWLSLNSLQNGEEYASINLPLADYVEAITPKSLTGSVAEYYLLDTCGRIWTVSIAFPSFELVDLQEIAQTGIPAENGTDGFYYDGTLLYRTYFFDRGSILTAMDPVTGITYDLGMLEQGVTVWGLHEVGTIPTVEEEVPPSVEIPLMGILAGDHSNDSQRLYSLSSNAGSHLECRGNPDLVLHSVVTQLNARGEIENYYFGTDNYVYTEIAQDRHFLERGIALHNLHNDYAAGPAPYQRSNGWVVGLDECFLTLTSLLTGDDVAAPVMLPEGANAISITPKDINRVSAEYYILDSDGVIWTVTIHFPDFCITNMEQVVDTQVFAESDDGFYFDGTWIYRTYVLERGSVLTMINPETGKIYDLGLLGQGVTVRGLYEDGKIPTVEHVWDFVNFEWEKTSYGYAAHAVYKCCLCGEIRKVDATVKTTPTMVVNYTAVIQADQSLDGHYHTDVYTQALPGPNPSWPKVKRIINDRIIGPVHGLHPVNP